MFNTSPDHDYLPHNNTTILKIKQDDKFFTRLLSKENSVANPSFRVYYGGLTGSVPFMWESQPGTPKSIFADTYTPPLTPPPTYYSKSSSKPIKHKNSRSGLLQALFPKIISLKKISSNLLPSSPSSSPMLLPRSRFSTRDDDDDETAAVGSPTSTLCFDIGRGKYW